MQLTSAARRFNFAEHQCRFTAEDILIGIIFHSRRDIGLLSLYYVTDARLAQSRMCASGFAVLATWCADFNLHELAPDPQP